MVDARDHFAYARDGDQMSLRGSKETEAISEKGIATLVSLARDDIWFGSPRSFHSLAMTIFGIASPLYGGLQ